MKAVQRNPDFKHVSTSFVERQNWTVRGSMRVIRVCRSLFAQPEGHAAATLLGPSLTSYDAVVSVWYTRRRSPQPVPEYLSIQKTFAVKDTVCGLPPPSSLMKLWR